MTPPEAVEAEDEGERGEQSDRGLDRHVAAGGLQLQARPRRQRAGEHREQDHQRAAATLLRIAALSWPLGVAGIGRTVVRNNNGVMGGNKHGNKW